jgi:hypothetical protein
MTTIDAAGSGVPGRPAAGVVPQDVSAGRGSRLADLSTSDAPVAA